MAFAAYQITVGTNATQIIPKTGSKRPWNDPVDVIVTNTGASTVFLGGLGGPQTQNADTCLWPLAANASTPVLHIIMDDVLYGKVATGTSQITVLASRQ